MKKIILFIAALLIILFAFGVKKYVKDIRPAIADSTAVVDDVLTTDPSKTTTTAEKWNVSMRTTDLEGEKPRYEAIICDANGKTIQVIAGNTSAYRPQDLLKPFGKVQQADVDFDGHTDIIICLGIQPLCGYITHYDAWLYNPQTGKFDYHEDFGNICNPEVDTINKYVTNNYMLDSVTKHCIAYAIQKNGTLKELKSWQQKVIPYK